MCRVSPIYTDWFVVFDSERTRWDKTQKIYDRKAVSLENLSRNARFLQASGFMCTLYVLIFSSVQCMIQTYILYTRLLYINY